MVVGPVIEDLFALVVAVPVLGAAVDSVMVLAFMILVVES